MTSLSRPRVEFISTILQTVLNLGLLCLGLILVVFLGKETVHLADVLFAPEQTSKYELVEGLVVYFLYFEFIALIVKYFQSGFHFPLRYFVYIGITAIVRLIIVDHKSPLDVLIYSAAILLLVITLWLCNSKRLKRERTACRRRAGCDPARSPPAAKSGRSPGSASRRPAPRCRPCPDQTRTWYRQ